ncbi:MAG TPA: NEW3 domain-containing protein [Terriglobales bacterium]|nr:NEW3 domain-containing protein [Terriglobales bacterium]
MRHPTGVANMKAKLSGSRKLLAGLRWASWLALIALGWPVSAQTPAPDPYRPLPYDTGKAGLEQMLRKLGTTARLLHTTAHPDDEDGGMMTLESRGRGATVLLLTLNRGEGGQNKTSSNLSDELGVLRTLELLASDRYYDVEQRFTRVVDYGYSKSAEEAFAKWQGHDVALADMVRVIRTFRPDVLVSRFQGTSRDGHGQHQAAGILSREAFRAAADPNRFPEQIAQGLAPWQPKKLYIDNIRREENPTLSLETSQRDEVLGKSYVEVAFEGLGRQLSQGAGEWRLTPGPRFANYKLVDSVLAAGTAAAREQDYFDGIDTTLPGLAARLGKEESKAAFLRPALIEIESRVTEAKMAAGSDPAKAGQILLRGLQQVRELVRRVERASLSVAAKADLLTHLRTKEEQFDKAAALALGLEFRLEAESTTAMLVPGQSFRLTARVANRGARTIEVKQVKLDLPQRWTAHVSGQRARTVAPGEEARVEFEVKVPEDADITRPYWRRGDPERESVYTVDDAGPVGEPLPPIPVRGKATYELGGLAGSLDAAGRGKSGRPLAVVPAFSVLPEPPAAVVVAGRNGDIEVRVAVRNNREKPADATLRLEVPDGWSAAPAAQAVSLPANGSMTCTFLVSAPERMEGRHEIRAGLEHQGHVYTEGFSIVEREDLGASYFFRPAVQHIRAVEVAVPEGLKIGYVMGAGDDIPGILRQLGLDVTELSPADVSEGDLSRYQTVILGIRAYDVREDVRRANRRLLDYVEKGGTLIVQYNSEWEQFNSGNYMPYPARVGRVRVATEEAPVEILAPEDVLFRYPNQIRARDFEGWVQERGLYFMEQWDERYQPLLASHDPGEPALPGGLLRARYGKGTYIFTGYSFFRQLPAGVPGAVRLFVNLLSAGHEPR